MPDYADETARVEQMCAAFKARAQAEAKRVEQATDSEYWFCLCFHTRDDKEAFLQQMGWTDFGDKYLDGSLVAARLGITLSRQARP